jgi:glycosyltransferase involved in cell wall biosynthesis
MKVVFALSVHKPDDERVWFQQAATLREAGYQVLVIKSSTIAEVDDIPNVIICDSPKAVFQVWYEYYCKHTNGARTARNEQEATSTEQQAINSKQDATNNRQQTGRNKQQTTDIRQPAARNKRPHILYDITEWYPSKKNLRGLPLYHKVFKFFLLAGASILTGFIVSGFIFGEYYKALPFRRLFFWKKYIYLPYYAHTENIACYPARDIRRECVLLYAGHLTREKGFYTVLDTATECARLMPDTHIILRLISNDTLPASCTAILEAFTTNFTIEHIPLLPFHDFCAETGKADICLDLRSIDWENNRCLPVKLFYYLAAGRPVIYSNLKAIRKDVPEIESISALANSAHDAVRAIMDYVTDSEKYKTHCLRTRELAEKKYNWDKYEKIFVNFIVSLQKKY